MITDSIAAPHLRRRKLRKSAAAGRAAAVISGGRRLGAARDGDRQVQQACRRVTRRGDQWHARHERTVPLPSSAMTLDYDVIFFLS